jgi:two-component system, cell cycle response regulator CpdR
MCVGAKVHFHPLAKPAKLDRRHLRPRSLPRNTGPFDSLLPIGLETAVVSRVVLVVDDEPLVLDVTASMLEDLGCEAITATDGQEALEKLADHPHIDVLITDINMPGMDGYELAERAKQMREGLKVIALSGREQNSKGLPFIRKPFLASDLRRTMAEHAGLC